MGKEKSGKTEGCPEAGLLEGQVGIADGADEQSHDNLKASGGCQAFGGEGCH